MRSIVVGLGVQGYKRRHFSSDDFVAAVDIRNPEAHFRALSDVPLNRYDAALVCTPDDAKLELLDYLLGHGKHVLVEKPLVGLDAAAITRVEKLSRDQRALLRRNFLGFVFQGFNLLARTTALENVELPLLYRRQPASERREVARQALASVGLTGWETHTPAELSGGQQQRVAMARALVTQPLVLLADEPTGNLDSQRGREIMELIRSLNRDRGITLLVVTHDPDIASYADRVIRFVDGAIE